MRSNLPALVVMLWWNWYLETTPHNTPPHHCWLRDCQCDHQHHDLHPHVGTLLGSDLDHGHVSHVSSLTLQWSHQSLCHCSGQVSPVIQKLSPTPGFVWKIQLSSCLCWWEDDRAIKSLCLHSAREDFFLLNLIWVISSDYQHDLVSLPVIMKHQVQDWVQVVFASISRL